MKFGKNLPRNQVPEWSSNYMNYKLLKQIIKHTVNDAKERKQPIEEADLASFFYALDRSVDTVEQFYEKREYENSRRLKFLIEKYHPNTTNLDDLDPTELEDLVGALLELRSQLRKLQWFTEVNKRGFQKILKKLDKKTNLKTQARYLESKVLVKPFASGSELNQQTALVNDLLTTLSPYEEKFLLPELKKTISSVTYSDQPEIEELKKFLLNDDVTNFKSTCESIQTEIHEKSYLSLLQKAANLKSLECLKYIITNKLDDISDNYDIHSRNIIHKLIISYGRQAAPNKPITRSRDLFIKPAQQPEANNFLIKSMHNDRVTTDGKESNDETFIIDYILKHLKPLQKIAILAKDSYKRTPLHYSSLYGLKNITTLLIKYIKDFQMWDYNTPIDDKYWEDSESLTPIHLAVIGVHPLTTSVLLNSCSDNKSINNSTGLLQLAVKHNSPILTKLLIQHGLDVNFISNDENETCLYIASRLGYTDVVQQLLELGADTSIAENTFGWTPLFVSAAEGYSQIVDLLVKYNADIQKTDLYGWTAMEHACLRGHLEVAQSIKCHPEEDIKSSSSSMKGGNSSPKSESTSSSTKSNSRDSSPVTGSIFEPVKSFGHPFLQNESLILVTLGSSDVRLNVVPVQLDSVPFSRAHATQLDIALSLSISASNSTDEPYIKDLPIQDSSASDTILFHTKEPNKTILYFDLVPTYSSKKTVIGRAVAMLSSVRTLLKERYSSLHQLVNLPILQAETLEILGTLQFEFLIVNPFTHPNMSIEKSSTYWKSLITTRVIGHRGLGKNDTNRKSLQLGENTLESFIAAANLGASYVEFDVQLTKDYIPVIYHDFLVNETGIDVPMHALTLEQFLNVSEQQSQNSRSRATSPLRKAQNRSLSSERRRPRSYSVESTQDDGDGALLDRLKLTREFKIKGFKGNFRGLTIQSPFTTLEEVFNTLPLNVGFNIECKYPMLDESQAQDMDSLAIDMNNWVDTVLKCVYDHAKGRDIIFSSFHPDICLLLSIKQPSIPVLFLTEAGTEKMADIRAASLQDAIRFATKWNLLGIVSACQPLILCPRLIKVVKSSGLVCFSYGTMNNDPECARLQMKYGLDAVIVDSVLAVRQGLTTID